MSALPITAGTTRKGRKVAATTSGKSGPPENTTPYAVNIGMAMRTTIQLECASVSSSFAK